MCTCSKTIGGVILQVPSILLFETSCLTYLELTNEVKLASGVQGPARLCLQVLRLQLNHTQGFMAVWPSDGPASTILTSVFLQVKHEKG